MSIYAEPHLVTSGETAEIFGLLKCTSGSIASQPVTVYERPAGSGAYKVVDNTSTNSTGTYSYVTTPLSVNSAFYVTAGTARSGKRLVLVAPQVTLAGPIEGTQLKTGFRNRITFAGQTNPTDGGAEVLLEREAAISNEEWGAIQRGFVRADGSYSLTHQFIIPGDANLRVIVRRHGRFNVRGVSNTLSYEISQAQNPNLTILSSADPVFYGSPVTISGVLAGAPGQKVSLWGHPRGSGVFSKMQETTTEASGAYKFVVSPETENLSYQVTNGTIKSATLFQGVKYVLTAGVSATTAAADTPITFSGTVTPADAGKEVYLERANLVGGGFHVVDVTSVLAGGAYSIPYTVFGAGKQTFRVHVPGDPAHQAASSAMFTIEVTPAPIVLARPGVQGKQPN